MIFTHPIGIVLMFVCLHLPWWGRCEYLLQEKGQDFVHQIQARFPQLFEQVSKD